MRRSTGVALVILSAGLLPGEGAAQSDRAVGSERAAQQSSEAVGGEGGLSRAAEFRLGRNYPNPFHPDTRIPFRLFDEAFAEDRPATVTIQIFNILRQDVAHPTALGHPTGKGTPLVGLEYTAPGRHEAYWDGRDRAGNVVAAGVYILELTVNGRSQARRIFVRR